MSLVYYLLYILNFGGRIWIMPGHSLHLTSDHSGRITLEVLGRPYMVLWIKTISLGCRANALPIISGLVYIVFLYMCYIFDPVHFYIWCLNQSHQWCRQTEDLISPFHRIKLRFRKVQNGSIQVNYKWYNLGS